MKTTFFILMLGIMMSTITFGQNEVCPPNEITTNPSTSTNGSAPDPKFINEFNWFAETANELLNIPIYDLSAYYPISSMLNPYDVENELCYYLANANLGELDVQPEEGWELLFINLGHYPDLTLLSAEIETSANADQKHIKL